MNYQNTESLLKKYNQQQLLKYYDELSEEDKRTLLDDIEKVNFGVIKNIHKKSEVACGGKLEPCKATSLKDVEKNYEKYTQEGINLLNQNKVGAVLLAGGQGTRLGFSKPKGMFDIGETRSVSIFELLMQKVKSIAAKSKPFPLFIMTSTDNNADTVQFFKDNNYFGYPQGKIHFYIQDTEPACDLNGKIFLSAKNRVLLTPNGNGGWYSSLVNAGLGKVLEKEGVEWLNVFGVDNVLQKICDPAFIGATKLSGFASSAKVVKKCSPEEKVGVLCEQDGKPVIVEYFEMPEELAKQRDSDGELSYRFGVILNYLFRVDMLNKTVKEKLPYHLAVKALAHIEDGKLVKPEKPNGYKFETLVVDMIKFMGSCLAYEVVREKEFAPVKNKSGIDSVDTARALLKLNGINI
ncbi:MAG: UTP--glucose-1-phosphate uridylyltransferase [Clostridia bacterium]|nr:UTP--glucose-1-phosphate uridylyltransferase [Clostridia bacterium]